MGLANFVPTIIINITSVGAALNMQQLPSLGIKKLDSYQRINITILVGVGIIFAVEGSRLGVVLQVAHGLPVGRILAVAVNPHLVQIIPGQLSGSNSVLDIGWNFFGHGVGVVVVVVDEVVDLVELEEDAGLALVVAVAVLAAGTQLGNIKLAHLNFIKKNIF